MYDGGGSCLSEHFAAIWLRQFLAFIRWLIYCCWLCSKWSNKIYRRNLRILKFSIALPAVPISILEKRVDSFSTENFSFYWSLYNDEQSFSSHKSCLKENWIKVSPATFPWLPQQLPSLFSCSFLKNPILLFLPFRSISESRTLFGEAICSEGGGDCWIGKMRGVGWRSSRQEIKIKLYNY
jgi:hypothetical protein